MILFYGHAFRCHERKYDFLRIFQASRLNDIFFLLQPFVIPMRVLMLLGGGLLAVFGSEAVELGGAGPLAVVAAAFVSCYFWQEEEGWEVDEVSSKNQRSFGRNRDCLFRRLTSKTRAFCVFFYFLYIFMPLHRVIYDSFVFFV